MLRVAHLSDLHHQLDWRQRTLASTGWRGALGRLELHGFGRLKRFEGVGTRIARLVEQVSALEVDRVLITGDLSALGDAGELVEVRQLLSPLITSGKLALIPGNHDRYTDAPAARGYERLFPEFLVSDLPEYADAAGFPFVKLVGDDFALIGLDSTRVGALSHYFVGRVGADQRERLVRVLDDSRLAGRTALVLCHHGPLGPSQRFDWRESGLLDAAELLEVLEGRPVVLHHGHSHHRYWHKAGEGVPHLFGGGSSTQPGGEGLWLLEIDDHRHLEARELTPT